MWIKYIIPEDGDEHTHPNLYQLNSGNAEVTVGDIVSSFPVPGKYHFRFLKTVGNFTVWLDSPEANAAAPSFQGSIFIKASRTAVVESNGRPTKSANVTANLISEPEAPSQPSKPLLDEQIFDNPTPTVVPTKNFGDNDLLGLSGSSSAKANSAASSDPFGFDTLQPANLTPTSSSSNIPAMNPMSNPSNRGSTASPMPGAMGGGMNSSAMRNPPMQQGGFAPMGGGGMNPMAGGGGMGSMNPMNRGVPPMGGAPRGGFDPFDNLNNGFGNQQQQSQYNRGAQGGQKRNF